jgi:peptidoglycan hydrolase-like protein with peptidoglycan-binding domain
VAHNARVPREGAAIVVLVFALGAGWTSGVVAQSAPDPVADMQRDFQVWAPDARVRDAQQVLRGQGYYKGELDGTMNPKFRRALWDFQGAKGLRRTAQLDAPTLAALAALGPP